MVIRPTPRCLTGIPTETLLRIKELLEEQKKDADPDLINALDQLIEITQKSVVDDCDNQDADD